MTWRATHATETCSDGVHGLRAWQFCRQGLRAVQAVLRYGGGCHRRSRISAGAEGENGGRDRGNPGRMCEVLVPDWPGPSLPGILYGGRSASAIADAEPGPSPTRPRPSRETDPW